MNKIYDILQIVIVFGIIIAIYTVLIITIILNKKFNGSCNNLIIYKKIFN